MKKLIIYFLVLFTLVSCDKQSQKTNMFFGVDLEGFPITEAKLKNIENQTSIKADVAVFYMMWPKIDEIDFSYFPRFSLEAINNYGSLPCLTWEPMYLEGKNEKAIYYQSILNGLYDKYLDIFVEGLNRISFPIIIRFAHEMNLSRYHWGKDGFDRDSPDIYVQMFRYIVNYFNEKGSKNVLWAFCPNADSVPNFSWNKIESYYPGDEYVDILGIDGYNFGLCAKEKNMGWTSSWRSFEDIMKSSYTQLKKISKKPIFIFETGCADRGGDKANWIAEALETSEKLGLKAFSYFQVDKECKWKIKTVNEQNVLNRFFIKQKLSATDWAEGVK